MGKKSRLKEQQRRERAAVREAQQTAAAAIRSVEEPARAHRESLLGRYVLPVLAIFALCAVYGIFPIESEDIFSNVVTGHYLWEHGGIPEIDPFSYTGPHHWFLNRPLPSIIFFLAHSFGGLPGVQLLCAAILGLTYSLTYVIWSRRTRMPLVAFVTVMVMVAISCYWFQARIYLFSYLFTAIALAIITSPAPRVILLAVPLQIAWINTHPSAILGVFFAGVWWLSRTRAAGKVEKLPTAMLVAVVLSNIASPMGLGAFGKFIDEAFGKHPSRTNILEWFSPFSETVSSQQLAWWFYGTIIVFAWAAYINIFNASKIRSAKMLFPLSCVFFFMAVTSARHVPLFYLVFSCLVICTAEFAWKEGTGAAVGLVGRHYKAAVACVAVCSVALLSWTYAYGYRTGEMERRISFGISKRKFPERPIEILKNARVQGNIFRDYGSGSFFLYKMFPDYRVNIDSARLDEVYGEEGFLHYMKIGNDINTLKADIAQYDIRAFIMPLPPNESEIVVPYRFLSSDSAWRLAYFDDAFMLFVRADEAQARAIPTYTYLSPLPLPGIGQLLKTKPDSEAGLAADFAKAETISPKALSVLALKIQYELALGRQDQAKATFVRIAHYCRENDPTRECRLVAQRYLRLFPAFLAQYH